MPSKIPARIKIAVTVAVVVAVCWVVGCAKKSRQEAVPETHDTLLITHDTLPEIPNTLTDKRDGKTYKTVTIGKQTWMAENLNYAMKSGSWCYDNDPSYCNTYGRLYDWNAAKMVCPEGWHLPAREEWGTLAKFAGGTGDYGAGGTAGKALKSTSGWYDRDGNNSGNGTDNYGFSALPGGGRTSGGNFNYAGDDGYWWTATEVSDGYAYYRSMDYSFDNLDEYGYDKGTGFSVRCVGD